MEPALSASGRYWSAYSSMVAGELASIRSRSHAASLRGISNPAGTSTGNPSGTAGKVEWNAPSCQTAATSSSYSTETGRRV